MECVILLADSGSGAQVIGMPAPHGQADLTIDQRRAGIRALQRWPLHPAIRTASENQLTSGHYGDAVRNACLALDALVHAASLRWDKFGADLMMEVFDPNRPMLAFNELKDDADQNEQKGMMLLYTGAMLALRNSPQNKLLEFDAKGALEAITLISFLANQLDRVKKVA